MRATSKEKGFSFKDVEKQKMKLSRQKFLVCLAFFGKGFEKVFVFWGAKVVKIVIDCTERKRVLIQKCFYTDLSCLPSIFWKMFCFRGSKEKRGFIQKC